MIPHAWRKFGFKLRLLASTYTTNDPETLRATSLLNFHLESRSEAQRRFKMCRKKRVMNGYGDVGGTVRHWISKACRCLCVQVRPAASHQLFHHIDAETMALIQIFCGSHPHQSRPKDGRFHVGRIRDAQSDVICIYSHRLQQSVDICCAHVF